MTRSLRQLPNRETIEAYGLATVGAVGGLWKYYKPEPSTMAWGAIIAGVSVYEYFAPEGQLLSERVDRAIENHPIAVPLAIGITALHLANKLPERVDPFSRLLALTKRV